MCFAHSVRQRPIRAGYRNHTNPCAKRALRPKGSQNLSCSYEAYDADAGVFDFPSPALFTVYQRENASYKPFCTTHGLDSAQCRTTRGDYVFYYRNTVSFPDRSFEEFSYSMSLWFFPYRECA